MIPRAFSVLVAIVLASLSAGVARGHGADDHGLRAASDLSLDALPPLPRDPGNRWADDPDAAALGQRLFFDARLSSNGKVSCGACHDPKRAFQDNVPLGKGVGTAGRRTMPIAGTAYSPFLFWDGRKDSLWSQALGPLESPVEHGGNRRQYARVVATHYRADYERVFGPFPDLRQREGQTAVFVNIGKAIAAYERTIQLQPTRFDRFVAAWKRTGEMPKDVLDEKSAPALRFSSARRTASSATTGRSSPTTSSTTRACLPAAAKAPDRGRVVALAEVTKDEFNCRSRWSDAKPGECTELDLLPAADATHVGAFRVPSLRNVAARAPYMHAGQLRTMKDVLRHYNRAPRAAVGQTELEPLGLTPVELGQLEAFLRTLGEGT